MCEFLGENTSVSKLNNFQKNKFKWLQDSKKYTDTTKRTYWVIIDNNFNDIERKLNKDLYEFTSKEIIEVINSIIYTSVKTNTSLISIVSSYINWALDNGYKKGENPCKDINKSEIMMNKANTISRNIIRRKYIKLNAFFKLVDYLECSNIDKMLLVLARYGVNTQRIGNVRWEDVDSKNMVLNLNSNIQLPIDEKFLECLERAYKCETYDYKTSTLRYIDYGYILKVSDKSDSKLLNRNTLYTRTNAIFKNNGMPKISLIDLYHARQYDFLFELSKQKEKITYDDIKRILAIFGDDVTIAKAQSLKERFTVMYECWNDL